MNRPMHVLAVAGFMSIAGLLTLSAAPVAKDGNPLPPEIRAIVAKRCLECHAKSAFFKTSESLRASEAKSKLKAGKMPPKKSQQSQGFEGIERSTMLDFLTAEAPAK